MAACFKPTSVSRLHVQMGSIAVTSVSAVTAVALMLAARPATASTEAAPDAETRAGAETATEPATEPTPAGEAETVPGDLDPLEQAQAQYERGRAAFETADYDGAIAAWTEAYSSVPDTPDAARIKALLIYNLAAAREKLYSVTDDPKHLRQAKILLEEFEKSIPALYAEDEVAAETERVQERIGGIDVKLSEAEGDSGAGDGSGTSTDAGTGSTETDSGSDAGKGLIIGGAVALGLGVAGLGMMGAGLGLGAQANDISDLEDDDVTGRRDQFARGRTGNVLAIAGGIAGGVFAVTGAVLVGLGVKKKRSSVALGPGPGMAGLALHGRF